MAELMAMKDNNTQAKAAKSTSSNCETEHSELFFFFFNFGQSATIIFVLGVRQGEVAM